MCMALTACGRPSNRQLCEKAAEMTAVENPRRTIDERFYTRCERKVQDMRLNAGVLRFGGVASCMQQAGTLKEFYDCGVPDKPPPRH